MNLNLSTDTTQFLESLVASGQYPSAEDAVTEGLRLLHGQQKLQKDIQQGIDELDADQGIESKHVFAELRQRGQKLNQQAE